MNYICTSLFLIFLTTISADSSTVSPAPDGSEGSSSALMEKKMQSASGPPTSTKTAAYMYYASLPAGPQTPALGHHHHQTAPLIHQSHPLIQYIGKPIYSTNQPHTMLIIAQPALVPQHLLLNQAQQLLHYFQSNPVARHQLLYGNRVHPVLTNYQQQQLLQNQHQQYQFLPPALQKQAQYVTEKIVNFVPSPTYHQAPYHQTYSQPVQQTQPVQTQYQSQTQQQSQIHQSQAHQPQTQYLSQSHQPQTQYLSQTHQPPAQYQPQTQYQSQYQTQATQTQYGNGAYTQIPAASAYKYGAQYSSATASVGPQTFSSPDQSSSSVPVKSAPPVITGLENFNAEQQAQIKEQLAQYFGGALRQIDGNSLQAHPGKEYVRKFRVEFQPSSADTNNAISPEPSSSLTVESNHLNVYRPQYTKRVV